MTNRLQVRCPWKNLRLLHADGRRVDLHAWLQETGTTPIAECQVHLPLGRHEHDPMRVVRCALPPEEAAAARKRVTTAKTLPETLFAAGYVLLLTNLPTDRWSAEDILALYRYRWQIEIRIKRLKQVSTLSAIRCGDPAIALTILYAHLVVALLVEHATTQLQDEVPWWWLDQEYPANTWRIDAGIHARIVQQIRGWRWCLAAIEDTPAYRRIFCDTPSTRTLQSVSARHLPDHFPVSSP